MTELESDFYQCGHPRIRHLLMGSNNIRKGPCWGFGLLGPACNMNCPTFKLDNLKYLEKKYDEKGVIK